LLLEPSSLGVEEYNSKTQRLEEAFLSHLVKTPHTNEIVTPLPFSHNAVYLLREDREIETIMGCRGFGLFD
jgi:hypothetical protein